jgi:hypothetical protein
LEKPAFRDGESRLRGEGRQASLGGKAGFVGGVCAVCWWIEKDSDKVGGLRSLLGRISPDGHLIIILVIFFLLAAGSIYMTVSSIYNMGKRSERNIQIEHIRRLELEYNQERDSINQVNEFNYE